MLKKLIASTLLFLSISCVAATQSGDPIVLLKTNLGNIEVQLNTEKAPITSENFLHYVTSGFYNGTIFHRVIPNFMIQGGGFTTEMQQKPTQTPIKNEATNGLENLRGTIAMARTNDINSATSQFFINLQDNPFLNHSGSQYGYAVFGKVIKGMDVVDKIATEPTKTQGPYADVPVKPIIILSAQVMQ